MRIMVMLGFARLSSRKACDFRAVLSTDVHDKVPTKASLIARRVLP